MEKTSDIVASILQDNLVKIGFAAETEDLINNAHSKIAKKGLDLIVANDVSDADSGFGSDTNKVVLIDADGNSVPLGVLPKYEVGHRILDRLKALLE